MRAVQHRKRLLALAVPALASLAVAAGVAADPAAGPAPSWTAALSTVDSNDSNVAATPAGTTLGPGAAHAAGQQRRIGIQVLDAHPLAAPAGRIATALRADTPRGSTVEVAVRGRRADGGWTEWATAEHGVATLPVPARTVQARLLLTATRTAPVVRSLSLRTVPGAAAAPRVQAGLSYRVFATREGLVGGTTANGHVIVEDDHFVALPSRRALASNGGDEYTVQVCTDAGACEVAPVWDIGPWNTHDDYWNPADQRENFQDLPQGTPEAQAAYEDGYNDGQDGSGRRVANPAGIDLADGTFYGIGMPDNGYVTVTYLWTQAAQRQVTVHGTVPLTTGPHGRRIGQVTDNATVPVLQTATGPHGTADRWYRIAANHWIPAPH